MTVPDRSAADPPVPEEDPEVAAAALALAPARRMAPAAVVFGFGRQLRTTIRQFGLVVVVTALQAGGRVAVALVTAGVLVLAIGSLLSWWRFTFRVERKELIVEKGVLNQSRTAVPVERVQGVSVNQQLTHRLLGLVRVTIDSAGSSGSEIILDAVPARTARDLRRVVLGGARRANGRRDDQPGRSAPDPTTRVAGSAPPGPDDELLLRRSRRDLTVVALTQNPFRFLGAAVGTLVALTSVFDDQIDADQIGRAVQDQRPSLAGLPLWVLAAVLAIALLSVAGIHLRYHGLELRLTSRGLRASSGLIERRERMAPLARIQRIRWSANPLQRRLGLTDVTIDQVHAGPNPDEASGGLRLPGTTTIELTDIIGIHLPGAQRPAHLDGTLPVAVIQRELGFVAAGALGAVVVAALVDRGWVPPAPFVGGVILLALVVAALRVADWHRFRWGISPTVVEVSSGPVVSRHVLVQLHKVQHVSLRRGRFDRRRDLATVTLSTASGTVHLPHLEHRVATAVRNHTLAVVEADNRPWM